MYESFPDIFIWRIKLAMYMQNFRLMNLNGFLPLAMVQLTILDNYIINYFSKDRDAYYSVYNTANGLHQQGETDTTNIIPFFPRWQCAKGLVGILNSSDYGKWKPKKDSCDAALFIFHLK